MAKQSPTKQSIIDSPEELAGDRINIFGAREHNLKNVDLSIPRNALVCFTGLSGSGKSSLAFDTLYAEGQRRYMETFSAYARQFMGGMQRPDVDKIDGLSPVISIEQKTVSRNPRSTVGTITEVYDFLRLLFARHGQAYTTSGLAMIKLTDEQVYSALERDFDGQSILLLAPLVRRRKGHYRELFEELIKGGYTKVRIDGEVRDLEPKMQLARYKIHDIELVVDRLKIDEKSNVRLRNSLATALKAGKGSIAVLPSGDEKATIKFFSRNLTDPETGLSYDEPQPNTFSFNSPYGWCPACHGLGYRYVFEAIDVIPDMSKTIKEGISVYADELDPFVLGVCKAIATKHGVKTSLPLKDWPEVAFSELLHGDVDPELRVYIFGGAKHKFEGLLPYFNTLIREGEGSVSLQENLKAVGRLGNCEVCHGFRLKDEALLFKIAGLHIGQVGGMQLDHFYQWAQEGSEKLEGREKLIAGEIYKEILTRTGFLLNIGLHYLSLHRPAFSLSGGEAQRIRLATQIGAQLINVTYILDEPSIGLHQRDNVRLISALQRLRDLGNTVIVVEHDKDMILAADFVVDIGPGAGIHGGHIVAQGLRDDIVKEPTSITGKYLTGELQIEVPAQRRPGNGKSLKIIGARGHNLKNVNISIPLGTMVCVTGVSGSGKSTLITDTLYPALRKHLYRTLGVPMPHTKVTGLDELDKVVEIDQAPIGRTPRSNPATYTGVFTPIRSLFSVLPEAKIRGYQPGRFSFNLKGGRCEDCGGAGLKVIEMNFLPDVHVTCPTCLGRRYNRETLEVRYKGKSINDVLDMSISTAVRFFENIPLIRRKIETLEDVGLGYLTLGQSSTTLSGGEAQRVKLATELSKRDTGKTMYILDEPTTGLHFEDIRILLGVLTRLVDRGNTVLVIEHNLDVIKVADHIIDMGPEGGTGGGEIVCTGTPEEVALVKESHTGKYLAMELGEERLELAKLSASLIVKPKKLLASDLS